MDLVDALEIYRAPIVIGDGMRALGSLDLRELASAHGRWKIVEEARLGSDDFVAYRRSRTGEI
jgi:diaminohydroxyphosphoribosylaminopyrimidine deaminase/5-amino-6-(5-phosphoribosylamino)uracil reductase